LEAADVEVIRSSVIESGGYNMAVFAKDRRRPAFSCITGKHPAADDGRR
jgi:hypothetical protein